MEPWLVVWLVIGLVIYFAYGMHKSRLGNPGKHVEKGEPPAKDILA